MKKFFILIVCLFLTLTISACGPENDSSVAQGEQHPATEQTGGSSDNTNNSSADETFSPNDDETSSGGVWTSPQKQ